MTEVYYVKPVDNSRLVPPADPREPRRYLEFTLLAAVIFSAVLYLAWQRLSGVQDGYRFEALQQEKQQWLEAGRKLRLEEASLRDPVRIDQIARAQLGLVSLTPHQILQQPMPAGAEQPVMAQIRPLSSTLAPEGPPGPWLVSPAKSVAAAVP